MNIEMVLNRAFLIFFWSLYDEREKEKNRREEKLLNDIEGEIIDKKNYFKTNGTKRKKGQYYEE
jgi:hypothetical protein